METIKAVSNSRVQHVRKLAFKRSYRYECGEYVADGANIVSALNKSEIVELFVSERRYDEYKDFGVPISVVTDKVMESMSDTESPQGIIAVAKIINREPLIGAPSVVLDNVSDPGNLGTILRTAASCGVENIVLYGNTCDPYSPKAVRASMGGIAYMRFTDKLPNILYVLDMNGENIFNFVPNVCNYGLVVGNEARGISEELREQASKVLSLPMSGKVESLNAGISMSVALYTLIYGNRK